MKSYYDRPQGRRKLEDRRNVGESSCNFGDGTDQRVQFLTFMIMMMMMMMIYTDDTNDIRRHKETRNSYKYDLPAPHNTWSIRNKMGIKIRNFVPSSI